MTHTDSLIGTYDPDPEYPLGRTIRATFAGVLCVWAWTKERDARTSEAVTLDGAVARLGNPDRVEAADRSAYIGPNAQRSATRARVEAVRARFGL